MELPVNPVLGSVPTLQKITAPLFKTLNKGKVADIVICFKALEEVDPEMDDSLAIPESADEEENVTFIQEERAALLEESMKAVIDLLEKQKDRLPFTWKLMYETNMIVANGADMKLVEDIAAIENVECIDDQMKKPKLWKRFKKVLVSKK